MADSAPSKPPQPQSVAAHHRIVMRRTALLAFQRPARLYFLSLLAFVCTFAVAESFATAKLWQQYIVCKDIKTDVCLTWLVDHGEALQLTQQLYPDIDTDRHCGLSDVRVISPHQKFITVVPFIDGEANIIFCKITKLKDAYDGKSMKVLNNQYRMRRQTPYSLRGRYRGQTQSQYLAIDRGNGKDDGKAEAHSAADSSRASVSGSSGMGQAQSQTMYDPSCDDCVGRPHSDADNLKHEPFGSLGGSPGGASIGSNIPGSTYGITGGGRPGVNGNYGPSQIGGPGASTFYPNGHAGFGPSQHGGGGGGSFRPNLGSDSAGPGTYGMNQNQPGSPGYGIHGIANGGGPSSFVPNQNGGYGGGRPGGSDHIGGLQPPGTVAENSHGALPGGNRGINPNEVGTGYPSSQSGAPQGPGTGNFQGSTPGKNVYGPTQSGSYSPPNQLLMPSGGTENYGPNQQGLPTGAEAFGPAQSGVPGATESKGNFRPGQHGLQGGTGNGLYGPNQIGGPVGHTGLGPTQNVHGSYIPGQQGGTPQFGSNQPSQSGSTGPYDASNWPSTKVITAPDGTTYYCCVAGPNNNPQYFKLGANNLPTSGTQSSGPYGIGSGTGQTEPHALLSPTIPYGKDMSPGTYVVGTPSQQGSRPYVSGNGGTNVPYGIYGNSPNQGSTYTGPYQTGSNRGPDGLPPLGGQYIPGSNGVQPGVGSMGGLGPYGLVPSGGQNSMSGGPGGLQGPTGLQEHGGLQGPGSYQGPGGSQGQGGLLGPGGQQAPGSLLAPGSLQGQGGLQIPGSQQGQGGPGNLQGPGGLHGPGTLQGQGGLQGPGGLQGQGGLQVPGGQQGSSGLQVPGGQQVSGGFQGPGGSQISSGLPGQSSLQAPGLLQGPGGQQRPDGQHVPGGYYGPGDQYGSFSPGGQNGLQGPGGQTGLQSHGPYSPGMVGGNNGLPGPSGGSNTGQNGVQGPSGSYATGPFATHTSPQATNGLYGPGTTGHGGLSNQYAPGVPTGQNAYGTPTGPYGTYGPGSGTGQSAQNPYATGPTGAQNLGGLNTYGPQGDISGGQNGIPNQYGTGQGSYGPQYGTGVTGTGQYGNGLYGPNTNVNSGQNVDYGGAPQNVMDPNSIGGTVDGDDSEAEASVSQAANGTVATASSKGGNDKGRAQTHVHGAYTGGGSFSAQAEISGENKAANSEVTGDKKGASSNAQGSGRNNKSQANVQLGSETGSVLTGSQSEGTMHSSNTQVQGSVKGGMADAQARGPGSTSSQAQIGFTPYKEGDKSHELQKIPFIGGGTAAAQSSGRTGSSQSQLRGTFKYGITYNGGAQAGASLDKDTVFSNRLPFDKIDVYDESNKNINVNSESTERPSETITENYPYSESPPVSENIITINESDILPSTDLPYETKISTEKIDEAPREPENEYGMHTHSDHHKTDNPQPIPTRTPPVESRRSFQSTYSTNSGDYEYTTDKDEPQPEDYDVDDGFGNEGGEATDVEQGEYSTYNEFSRDTEPTHQSLHSPRRKGLEVRQTTGGNTQHIVLGSLNNHDAEITQRNSERPDEGRVYQPGERVPGTGGYTIPVGFTGSVKSVASKEKTYVVGSKDSPSQAQTVSLTPGHGKIKYTYPASYGRNVNYKNLRSLYQPKPEDNNNRYMSLSKSVTRDLDAENNIRKQYSHTYYTKSSTCGYFTFTCTMVSGAEGRKKVCKPKIPTNPDGTPMKC